MTIQELLTIEDNRYPEIEAFDTGYLSVSPKHQLYYEQAGNPNGKPVVYLHGGPGGSIRPDCRQYFDPTVYRIVLFDQRGSGKSRPHAELEENNTPALVEDIETLRQYLGIERWHVFGGSWGSTLALLYAIAHPKRVVCLMLRGIFLGRQSDVDWSFKKGVDAFYPVEYEAYLAPLSEEERSQEQIVEGYYRLLTAEDSAVREAAAKVWSGWEGHLISLLPNPELMAEMTDLKAAVALARLECHYLINHLFMPSDNYILDHTEQLQEIPTIIVHGRYDMDCRLSAAYQLHQRLAHSELRIIEASGHSSSEPGICHALVKMADDCRDLI